MSEMTVSFTMHGIGVSGGIAIGHAHLFAGMGADDRVQASDLMDWLPDSMVRGSRNLLNMMIDYQRQATPTKTGARESKTSRGRL